MSAQVKFILSVLNFQIKHSLPFLTLDLELEHQGGLSNEGIHLNPEGKMKPPANLKEEENEDYGTKLKDILEKKAEETVAKTSDRDQTDQNTTKTPFTPLSNQIEKFTVEEEEPEPQQK